MCEEHFIEFCGRQFSSSRIVTVDISMELALRILNYLLGYKKDSFNALFFLRHVKRILAANYKDYPILCLHNNSLIDGSHRIIRALCDNVFKIDAIFLTKEESVFILTQKHEKDIFISPPSR